MATAKKILWAFLKLFAFWMVFFILLRIGFLLYEAHQLKGIPFLSILSLFWHALRLDVSATSFLMLFPFALWIIQSVLPRRFFDILLQVYVSLMIFVLAAITVGEMGVFDEWKTKLHYKALIYLAHPSEIVRTAETGKTIILSIIFILFNLAGYFIWKKRILCCNSGNFTKTIIYPHLYFNNARIASNRDAGRRSANTCESKFMLLFP